MALRMNPYITLDGNAKEAIEFYQETLGAKVIAVQTFGEMPEDPSFTLPAEAKDRILHGLLKVGETDLMFSDTFPGQQQQTGSRVSIALVVNSVEESQKAFLKLSQGGKVQMPLQKTFWSESYGLVTDKYDVQWQVTTE
jgi:PhnB protein